MHAILFLSSLHFFVCLFHFVKTKHPSVFRGCSVDFIQNCLTLTGLRPGRKYKVQSHRPWPARESLTQIKFFSGEGSLESHRKVNDKSCYFEINLKKKKLTSSKIGPCHR